MGEDQEGGDTSASATLTFDVQPANVSGLVIQVDDQSVNGTSHVLQLDGGRRVTIEARARGYLTFRRTVWVSRDKTVRIRLERPRETRGGPGSILDL